MNESQYMSDRVDNQIAWYGKKSAINKKYHIWCNSLIIFFGTMIPFVTTIVRNVEDANSYAAAFGVFTALFTGISALMKFHEKWANYRVTAEALRREKILYKTRSGPYQGAGISFQTFVGNVEKLLDQENKGWSQLVTSAPAQAAGNAAEPTV